jgi:hypothetical protein
MLQANATEIAEGASITFTLTSTGLISSAWIDGNAVTSPGSLTETPSSAGSYTARGEVSGPGGTSDCYLNYVVEGFAVGDTVETIQSANLYNGNSIAGSVTAGQVYIISAIQGGWVMLADSNGVNLSGWIEMSDLELAQ